MSERSRQLVAAAAEGPAAKAPAVRVVHVQHDTLAHVICWAGALCMHTNSHVLCIHVKKQDAFLQRMTADLARRKARSKKHGGRVVGTLADANAAAAQRKRNRQTVRCVALNTIVY